MSVHSRAVRMASVRAGIGVAAIAAPSLSAKITGYPAEQNVPAARVMGRLFGVRELLLAWLVFDAVRRPGASLPAVFAVQAAVDAGDAAVQSISIAQGDDLGRGGLGGIAIAAGAAMAWAKLARDAARA